MVVAQLQTPQEYGIFDFDGQQLSPSFRFEENLTVELRDHFGTRATGLMRGNEELRKIDLVGRYSLTSNDFQGIQQSFQSVQNEVELRAREQIWKTYQLEDSFYSLKI
jgi:hypothetical protein